MEEVESELGHLDYERAVEQELMRAAEMIAEADINHDGGVSYEEFVVVRPSSLRFLLLAVLSSCGLR